MSSSPFSSIRELVNGLGPASTAEDARILIEHPEVEEAHLLAALRKRSLASAFLEELAKSERFRSRHVVRAAIVNHPKTPRTLALRLVQVLFWKELLKVTNNYRLAMPIRVSAENRLRERLPELEMGERIALARQAPPGLLTSLASQADGRLMRAVLENPRLREREVLEIVKRPEVEADVLRAVSQSEQWASRTPIKLALVLHRQTPVHVCLSLLITLPQRTLERLLAEKLEELPRIARLGAERILAGEPLGRAR